MTTLIGALLIGATLGLLGSGGSAITVPILVYLIGHDAKVSIAESMAIVGFISVAGAVPKAMAQHIDWKCVVLFGIPAMLGTYVGAWLGGLASDALQLTVFGFVVILAAVLMMRKAFGAEVRDEPPAVRRKHDLNSLLKIIAEGVLVGMLTGFVGVGGGFLIVPALLMLEKLPIHTAIGTSLMVIALKSAVGFAKYQYVLADLGMAVDLRTILAFSLIGMAGCAIGQRLNSRMQQRTLHQVFAVFLVLVGAFVIIREGHKLITAGAAQPVSAVRVVRDRLPVPCPLAKDDSRRASLWLESGQPGRTDLPDCRSNRGIAAKPEKLADHLNSLSLERCST